MRLFLIPDTATPTAPATPAPAAPPAPRERKSATRQVEHRVPTGSNRELKNKLGEKLGDRLQEVANDGVSGGNEKIKIKSHFRSKGPKAPPPDPEPSPSEKSAAPAAKAPEPAVESKESTHELQEAKVESGSSSAIPAVVEGAQSSSTLPDAHRRSLENFGWTPEEIENGVKSGGPAFLATAAKIHNQRKNEIEAYARAGQAGLKAPEQKPVQQPTLPTQGTAEQNIINMLAQTKAAYPGNDKLFDMVFAPQLATARAQDAQASQQREQALQQQVSNFFNSKAVEHYKDFYGDAAEGQARKDKVVNTAAYIIHGAAAQHKTLTVEEALQMAHDSTAAPVAKQAARNEIISEVQQRAAGITQQNKAGGPAKTEKRESGPPSKEELLRRTGERMKAAGLRPS